MGKLLNIKNWEQTMDTTEFLTKFKNLGFEYNDLTGGKTVEGIKHIKTHGYFLERL